jgi:quinol monooxygenase YgiN
MIVVVGKIQAGEGQDEELTRVCEKVAAASREETGCIDYRFFKETERGDRYAMVEEWESMDALREHFGTPHIAEFMGAVGKLVGSPPDVQFHEVAKSTPLDQIAAAAGSDG